MAEYTVYTTHTLKHIEKECFMALNQSNSVKTLGSFFWYHSVEIFIHVLYLEKTVECNL